MTATGYGVLRGDRLIGAGKITTRANEPEPARLWVIFSELLAVIQEFQVTHVASEQFRVFFTNKGRRGERYGVVPADLEAADQRRGRHDRKDANPYSMFLMKSAQTATQMAALVAGCPLHLYEEHEWKGGRGVEKEALRERAVLLYRVSPTLDLNISDAIMVAHHHTQRGALVESKGVVLSPMDRAVALAEPMLRAGIPRPEIERLVHPSDRLDQADPPVGTPSDSLPESAGSAPSRPSPSPRGSTSTDPRPTDPASIRSVGSAAPPKRRSRSRAAS